MIEKTILIALSLALLFILLPTIVLTNFNTAYNYTVTGLSSTTLQGILLIVLVVALIGFVMYLLPRTKMR